jgi:hypothetical protein
MREFMVSALVLLGVSAGTGQTVPQGWKPVRDARGLCQISVPPEWAPLEGSSGAAVLRDSSTALAAVTSQPGQAFRPLTESLLRLLAIPKERMFENSAKRVFYQDKVSKHAEDPNGFCASVPAKGGTCSCRVSAVPTIPVATAKSIALSLVPVAEDEGEKPQLRTGGPDRKMVAGVK